MGLAAGLTGYIHTSDMWTDEPVIGGTTGK